MILRRNPAVRRHVARLAVVSLIGLGLVGLSGAANADKPGDLLTNPSSGSDICLPKTPDGLPVHLHACLKQHAADPSTDTPSPDPSPSDPVTSTDPQTGSPSGHHHVGPICVPVPADLLKKLPTELIKQLPHEVPTCIPECLSDSVLHLLKKLPEDTLDELLADITSTLGELPSCLLSALPSTPPSSPPPANPPSHHRHHKHYPHINKHIPYNAGPASPVGGSPDFTG